MGKGVRMLTVGDFRARFGEEAQCAEQLTRERWPEAGGVPLSTLRRLYARLYCIAEGA
jgi:hypothetical protein